MKRERTRGPRRAALVAALVVTGCVLAFTPTAGADTAYTATSSASGVTAVVTNGTIPLVPGGALPVGGPDAQTLFSSAGQSHAFAASPDPGTTVAEAPGLAGNPGGLSYPFFAITDIGQPPKDGGTPGNTVHAESHASFAAARGVQGEPGGGSATADSRSGVAADGTVTATATADVSALSVTGAVTVTGVHTDATAARTPSGGLTRHGTLVISAINVGGQAFGFQDGRFTFAGSDVPVPANDVFSQLAAAGVTATFQAERDNPDGLVGASLSLSTSVPTPAGVTHCTFILGQAAAAVSLRSFATGSGAGGGTGAAPAAPAAHAPGAAPAAATTPTTAAPGPVPGPDGGALSPPAPVGVASTAAGSAPQVAPPVAAPSSVLIGMRAERHTDSANIYLAIAAAGLIGLLGLQILRILGVRITWE